MDEMVMSRLDDYKAVEECGISQSTVTEVIRIIQSVLKRKPSQDYVLYSDFNNRLEIIAENFKNGEPFAYSTKRDEQRKVFGVLLALVNVRSYRDKGVMLSSVVVAARDKKPKKPYFELMKKVGYYPEDGDSEDLWRQDKERALKAYRL